MPILDGIILYLKFSNLFLGFPFGEQLAATSEQGLVQEASCKIQAYQRIKRYSES